MLPYIVSIFTAVMGVLFAGAGDVWVSTGCFFLSGYAAFVLWEHSKRGSPREVVERHIFYALAVLVVACVAILHLLALPFTPLVWLYRRVKGRI